MPFIGVAIAASLAPISFGAPTLDLPHERGFQAWASEHGKTYGTTAARERALNNYIATDNAIREMVNSDPEDGAEYGHNRFSDMSNEEFRAQYLGIPASGRHDECLGGSTLPIPSSTPASHDWREHGAVGPVRDQGGCGSCWAESAVANMEGVHYVAHGNLPKLSLEQILECDPISTACYGGWPSTAYKHVISAGGLAADDDYPERWNGLTICLANQEFNETCGDGMCDDPPLTSWCDVTCEAKKHKKVTTIHDWATLPQDEDAIAALLAKHGPISVAIDASGGGVKAFLFPWLKGYKKGIANHKNCPGDALDHGVTIVGFGEEAGTKYWTIKNSWGDSFGEGGYFRMIRGIGSCGVDTCATTAIINGHSPSPPTPVPSPTPRPSSGHYGQPPCGADETEMQFGGGSICASKCASVSDCPSDVPAGTKATPQCSLLENSHCGLRCGRDAGCPEGAKCSKSSAVALTGNCVYSSSAIEV